MTTQNAFYHKYEISENEINTLTPNETQIINSFEAYFNKNQTLTEKQEDLLQKLLKRRLILNIEYIDVNEYSEQYFKCDHHGDYLQTSFLKFSKYQLSGEIKDLHADQYGTSSYIDRYNYNGKTKIPNTIKNLDTFAKYYYKDFKELVRKFNTAKTDNSKYKIHKAIKSILNETYDDALIDSILRFKHWSA